MLQWAWEEDWEYTRHHITTAYAAKGGHMAVLQWLYDQGCDWGPETCAYAARGGHQEMLQWLRDRECPWNSFTCRYAARYGHLEVLRWAQEHRCPTEGTVNSESIMMNGDVVVMHELYTHHDEWGWETDVTVATDSD